MNTKDWDEFNKINFVDGKGVQRINNEILKLAKMENS